MLPLPPVYICDRSPAVSRAVRQVVESLDLQGIELDALPDFAPHGSWAAVIEIPSLRSVPASWMRTGIDLIPLTNGDVSAETIVRDPQLALKKPLNRKNLAEVVRLALARRHQRQIGSQILSQDEIQSRLASLSAVEKAVLELIVAGEANKIIAQILRLGLRTVELYRQQVFRAFSVDNLASLVRMTSTIRFDEPQTPTMSGPHFAIGEAAQTQEIQQNQNRFDSSYSY